jgi:hypothetical protein
LVEERMNDRAFPSEPVKAALRSRPDDPTHFFREALADALPSPTMYATAFPLAARFLLHERKGSLSGYPPVVYAAIDTCLPSLAREVLPEDVREDVAAHLEAT